MNRLCVMLLAVATLALNACGVDVSMFRKRDFSIDPTARFNGADLSRLKENPSAYRSTQVRFKAIVNKSDETLWEPYYTGVGSNNYYAFSVWPEGAKLWTEEGWMTSLSTIYVRKDNPNMKKFLDLERFSTIEIKGTVMSDFYGMPWVVALYVNVLSNPLYTQESLDGFLRGIQNQTEKRNAAAIQDLERAASGTLPKEAAFEACWRLGQLYEDRAKISRSINDYDNAANNYGQALRYDRSHTGAAEGVERCEAEIERIQMILERQQEEAEMLEEEMEEFPAEEPKK